MPARGRTIGDNYYPLRDQVRDELRSQISDGRILPGQRLIERVLAEEFGVSRIPVREALRGLESEGLVKMVPRRGMVASELSKADISQLYQVRSVLEVLGFSLAAESATESDIESLSESLKAAREAFEDGDFRDVVRHNAVFHETVAKIAGNPFLSKALEPLTSGIRWMIGHGQKHEQDLAEHAALLAAIEGRDAQLAAELAWIHMEGSRQTQSNHGTSSRSFPIHRSYKSEAGTS